MVKKDDQKEDEGLTELKRFLNVEDERVSFFKQCIINKDSLPLRNDLYLAHCWRSLSEEDLLALVKQNSQLIRILKSVNL